MTKRLKMASNYSTRKAGDALLVWKDSTLIYENYHNGFNPSTTHPLYDATTLLSGLVAISAIDDGLIKLNEPVSNIISAWKDDPQKSKITVSQLLHLTSGIKADDYQSTPTYHQALKNPIVYPPGKQFFYGPASYQVFGGMMTRNMGIDYPLKKQILLPIGVPGARWLIVGEKSYNPSQGNPVTIRSFDGAQLTARELGHIGILLLHKGHWKGRTILKNVDLLTKPTTEGPSGYGLGVWLNNLREPNDSYQSFSLNTPAFRITLKRSANQKKLIYDGAPSDLFMAAGRKNQRLYVIPSKKLVIVRFGGPSPSWNDAEFLARLLEGKRLKNVVIHRSSKPD
jgi:CubicO group peptidase (beta-lactamase class C family)